MGPQKSTLERPQLRHFQEEEEDRKVPGRRTDGGGGLREVKGPEQEGEISSFNSGNLFAGPLRAGPDAETLQPRVKQSQSLPSGSLHSARGGSLMIIRQVSIQLW